MPDPLPARDGRHRLATWLGLAAAFLLVVGASVAGTVWWTTRSADVAGLASAPEEAQASSEPTVPDVTPTEPVPREPPQDFSETYADVESGVVRILATTCDGDGIGTGFLLGARTVATAAHVVDGASAIAVDGPSGPQPARVLGFDLGHDLAILRLSSPIEGHVFSFAATDAAPGMTVAAIGFPLDEPKTLTLGVVSGLDRTIRIDGRLRSGLLQTDTAINPGNSGGPLVTQTGEVIGVVDALRLRSRGIGYAVQVSIAEPVLTEPAAMTTPATPDCSITEAPDQLTVAPRLLPAMTPTSAAIQNTLGLYYNAINSSDYDAVIDQFAPEYATGFDADELATNLATSIDFNAVIHSVSGDTTDATAAVTFVSLQGPSYGPEGEACTKWSLDYSFTRVGERLLIDGVAAHSGDGHEPC
jgi:S1-C subfamily serine protease